VETKVVKSHYTVNLDAEIVAKLQLKQSESTKFNASKKVNEWFKIFFSFDELDNNLNKLNEEYENNEKQIEIMRIKNVELRLKIEELKQEEFIKIKKASDEKEKIKILEYAEWKEKHPRGDWAGYLQYRKGVDKEW
jgi:hypothetical protein